MYHRIVEPSTDPAAACDPWAICVTSAAFTEQMQVLAEHRTVIDLGELAAADTWAKKAPIAVTFDDGYLDNLVNALPILERWDIPATVFVVGNAVGRTREFWWDALDRALLSTPQLPVDLDFPFGSGKHTFRLVEQPGDAAALAGWRAETVPHTARQHLFRELWDAIVVLEPAAQDDAVDHLLEWAGQPMVAPAIRGPVDAEQLHRFAAHPLITVGSHTLDHPSLTDLSPAMQRVQIHDGHRRVEELVGGSVDRFSYPFGRVDASARTLVAELGVSVACTSEPIPAISADDPLRLPRLQAVEMGGEDFERWLRVDHGLGA